MPTFFQGNQKPCAASWAPTKLRSSNIDFSLQLLRTSLFTYPTFSKDVHSSSFIRAAARMTTRFAARLFAEVDSDAVAFGAEEDAYRFSPAATCPCLNPVRRIASHNLPPYRPTRHIPCIQPVTTQNENSLRSNSRASTIARPKRFLFGIFSSHYEITVRTNSQPAYSLRQD